MERRETRTFDKEATVTIKVGDNRKVTAKKVIESIEDVYGNGVVYACIPRAADGYEVTVNSKSVAERLAQGVKIDGKTCVCNLLVSDTVVVSFLHLPAYILDSDIIEKLQGLGIKIVSEVQRRYHSDSDVVDGTRIVKVKFPKNIVSLSYLRKFNTVHGPQLFRVIHNDQTKVCALSYSQDHLMADCHLNTCYRCHEKGHEIKRCVTRRCIDCGQFPVQCECTEDSSQENTDDDSQEEYTDEELSAKEETNEHISYEQQIDNKRETVNKDEKSLKILQTRKPVTNNVQKIELSTVAVGKGHKGEKEEKSEKKQNTQDVKNANPKCDEKGDKENNKKTPKANNPVEPKAIKTQNTRTEKNDEI